MTHSLKTLAAASVAAAALITPATAFAGDYRKCKDTEAAVAGGLIGGSIGTVIGEELAGRGDKTEGAIAGALIGGVIGAAVGDGASDCEKDGKIYRYSDRRAHQTVTHYPATTRVHHRSSSTHRHYDRRQYNRNSYDRNYYDRGYGYGYNDRYERRLNRLNRRIERLRHEGRELKRRRKYEGNRRWIERAIRENGRELDYLKDERRRLKRQRDRSRRTVRRGHYHGNNICYMDH